jgi:hypothetical protein
MNNLNPFNMSWLLMSQKTCSSQVHSNITRAMHAALRFFSRRRCVTSSTNLALSWAAAHALLLHHHAGPPRYGQASLRRWDSTDLTWTYQPSHGKSPTSGQRCQSTPSRVIQRPTWLYFHTSAIAMDCRTCPHVLFKVPFFIPTRTYDRVHETRPDVPQYTDRRINLETRQL